MILVILGSYCFTAFIHEPSHRSRALRETGRTSTMLRWNSVLMDIPAIRLFPSATVNMETNMVLRVSENGGYTVHKKRATFMVSFIYIQIATNRNTFHGAYMNMTINRFLGKPISEQPTQFCECKKDQASSKTKGDWALISPEMLSQRPLKWVQYANIFRKSVRKQAMCLDFFCWTAWSVAVASHCPLQMIGWMAALSKWRGILLNFTVSAALGLFHELFISRIRNEPCEISSWPPAGSMSYYDILFESIFVSTIFPGRKPWVFSLDSVSGLVPGNQLDIVPYLKKHWGEWTNIQNILVPCEPSHFSSWSLPNFHHQTKPSRP